MGSTFVDRATSDVLIGPDWAMNIDICDYVNRDPGQTKEVIKSVKKRISSKNPQVQLLALTLLETMVKNCGDVVHMQVAERDVLHEMVKIVKKKPTFQVKEKILTLIDTWQEAFGGPRGRHPQYYAAYQELLRSGAVFPKRSESSAPIFTPPQTHPLSHPQTMHAPERPREALESSIASDFPTLSQSEIQNAHGIMDVLAEMLSALEPTNKEGLKQEVIVDLVDQCRSYKQRVVHLVNTTSDEELLAQGLALNDDLERVLAKHNAIASGTAYRVEKPKPSPTSATIGDSSKTRDATSKTNGSSTASTSTSQPIFGQLALPAPPSSEKSSTAPPPPKMDPHMDLLSGDDFLTPPTENSLALVPVDKPQSTSTSEQTDVFSQHNNINNSSNAVGSFNSYQSYPASQILHLQQQHHTILQSNGSTRTMVSQPGLPQYGQGSQFNPASPAWNNQGSQSFNTQQQPLALGAAGQGGEALPPPPWETQSTEASQPIATQTSLPLMPMNPQTLNMPTTPFSPQSPTMPTTPFSLQNRSTPTTPSSPQSPMMQNPQFGGMYQQQMLSPQMSSFNSYPMQGAQMATGPFAYSMQGMQLQAPMQAGQMGGYGYPQQLQLQYYPYSHPNEIAQRMYGLSLHSANSLMNPSSQTSTSSSLQQQNTRPSKPEDNLFGDLWSIAKSKQMKPPMKKTGSL